MQNDLRTWLSVVLLLSMVSVAHGGADLDDFYEVRINGNKFWAILESLPYAAEGQGPVMYVIEHTECKVCQKMYKDFGQQNLNFEIRHLFVPVSARTQNETVALGKSRLSADYHTYMQRRKTAPDFKKDRASIHIYNQIVNAVTQDLPVILKQNGWPLKSLGSPQIAWKESGKVFTSAGYSKLTLTKAMARAEKGSSASASIATITSKGKAPSNTMAASGTSKSHMTRRNPSLEQLDIQGVRLGMRHQEVEAVLISAGWKLAQKNVGLTTLMYSHPKNPKKFMTLNFWYGNTKLGVTKIHYTSGVDIKAAKLDVDSIRDKIVTKYGKPDHERAYVKFILVTKGKFVDLTFNDYANIPTRKEATLLCKEYLMSQGQPASVANQKAGGYLPLPDVEGLGLDQHVAKNCPAILGMYRDMTEAAIAPTLTVNLNFGGLQMNMEWKRPQYEQKKKIHEARRNNVEQRQVVDDVGL